MGKRNGRQKGPQQHAEGQHGERTHRRFLEQIAEHDTTRKASNGDTGVGPDNSPDSGPIRLGGSRIAQGRHTNDPADRAQHKSRAGIRNRNDK